ncbi:MAG: flagellar FliJ family protein [Terriglobales bacterium]
MAFRFSLAAVLKYRKNLEQREYLALGRVHQEIAQVELELEQCREWLSDAAHRRDAAAARGIASVHLQEAYEREHHMEKQLEGLQVKQQELKVKRQQCLKAYELARQKREVLEELRSRQLQVYVLDQSRREQRRVDDMFLSRLKRRN